MQIDRPNSSVLGFACSLAFVAALSNPSLAQSGDLREHVAGNGPKDPNGLIGEPVDVSNWPHPAAPDANPFYRSDATNGELEDRELRAELGKALFWDEQVSTDNTTSCGTCHFNSAGGTDARFGGIASNGAAGAFGTIPQRVNPITGLVDYGSASPSAPSLDRDVTPLHTPTMIGSYLFNHLFWDMRAGTQFRDEANHLLPGFSDWSALEDLAVAPPINPVEMAHEGAAWASGRIQAKLNAAVPLELCNHATIPPDILWIAAPAANYADAFDLVFGNHATYGGNVGVTRERFAMAIATYIRTLVPDQAPIDLGAMTQEEMDGFQLMKDSGCFICHSASKDPEFGPDQRLVNPYDNLFSSGSLKDIGFGLRKVPTLRNVGLRKKFFSHGNGSPNPIHGPANSLVGLIDFYDTQNPSVPGLNLKPGALLTGAERAAVLAFLGHALTDPRVAAETYPFDRPQLASERKEFKVFEGNEYGVGLAYNGHLPEIIANSLPKVSAADFGSWPNAHFKIGVGDAAPLSPAFLLIGDQKISGLVLVGGTVTTAPMVLTDEHGQATAQAPVPLLPGSIGVPFFAQWVVSENGNASLSNGASFTPF